jgi:hypothetical protein
MHMIGTDVIAFRDPRLQSIAEWECEDPKQKANLGARAQLSKTADVNGKNPKPQSFVLKSSIYI